MARLENPFGIVINKAREGCQLSKTELGQRVGLTEQRVTEIEQSRFKPDDATLRRIAAAVNLHPDRLVAIAQDRYMPSPVDLGRWGCIAQITQPCEGVPTHSFLIWDTQTRDAALFDTAGSAPIHRAIQERRLRLTMLCLTHTHEDHVVDWEQIVQRYQPTILASPAEPLPGAKFVREGDLLRCRSLTLRVLETDGHSPGSLTFVVSGFAGRIPDVAVVGDAIFAGSIGGPKISFERVFSKVRDKILTLPGDRWSLPGPGPLMTVGEEKQNNPFFH